MLIHAVLGFSVLETLVLAALLLAWADRVAGARLLAAFLIGISLWMVGNELPNWLGPETEPVAMRLLATAPFTSALFFHFCTVFCRVDLGRWGVAVAYALGATASVVSIILVPGHLIHHRDIGFIAVADPVGSIASMAWVILGIGGVAVLLLALLRARRSGDGQKFRQIAAVTASCLWGLLCLAGYGIAVLDLPIYPFPLLGLPLYSLILVYGILRYGVFVANAWARRALVWALLLALGAVVLALTPLLPFESRWLGGLAVAASVLALNGPVRRVAERLVYPGGEVSIADLGAWRSALLSAETPQALGQQAAMLLSARIGTQVEVQIGAPSASTTPSTSSAPATPPGSTPQLVCTPGEQGWQTTLQGWDAAPPGPRHVAELFGTVVAEAAARVEQAQQFAARERERQLQARLAELGALAATVAHDIRNPLNIISMAVAAAPGETRREVADQVARIANLTHDLLDFAKPWKLVPRELDLAAHVRNAAMRLPDVTLGAGLAQPLVLQADPRRVDQALTNLLENARIALASDAGDTDAGGNAAAATTHSPVHIDAETTDNAVLLHICDAGPGVPDEIRSRLFEPFASRSPGGTGLGLAIVARIMAAHGGSVALTERPPWSTCFTLRFPLTTTQRLL
ncbi:HAMP domain-containing histidine kinase [Acidovorax sp. JMULE5]|uniref:sensor histidine kinase n=1 Tax=Acidovorax sp. JMULE5 TaxID=2518343 RepID=UPI0015A4727F|nr:HAMP domain-containing sensor histidine kinase [Acidovorax sp. JMULE5]QLA79926.1 HAMP domain-containing histidine kinase [Acidovorax sp. JMULE5]